MNRKIPDQQYNYHSSGKVLACPMVLCRQYGIPRGPLVACPPSCSFFSADCCEIGVDAIGKDFVNPPCSLFSKVVLGEGSSTPHRDCTSSSPLYQHYNSSIFLYIPIHHTPVCTDHVHKIAMLNHNIDLIWLTGMLHSCKWQYFDWLLAHAVLQILLCHPN